MGYARFRNPKLSLDLALNRLLFWFGLALFIGAVGSVVEIKYFSGIIWLIGFIMMCIGSPKVSLAKRCKKYATLLLADSTFTLPQIAQLCGRSPNKFMRELIQMVQRGWLPPEMLFTGGAKQKPRESEEDSTINTGVSKADALLEQGRSFVARLSMIEAQENNHEIRAKIKAARVNATAIFEFVFEHPEAADSLSRFMEYTLPEAVKLLTTYESISHKEVVTQQMTTAADSVLDTLDSIVSAMKAQLDALYRDLAVATKADASVYRTVNSNGGFDNHGL